MTWDVPELVRVNDDDDEQKEEKEKKKKTTRRRRRRRQKGVLEGGESNGRWERKPMLLPESGHDRGPWTYGERRIK